MSRRAAALAAAWLLAAGPCAAAVLCERAFMVRNSTDLPLSNVLVTITLEELGVPREQDVAARGVELAAGPAAPCQLDPFASVLPELSSEISLLTDLTPREARSFRVRLLDQPGAAASAPRVSVTGEKDRFEVVTPWAVYPVTVRGGEGLWVEQPRPGARQAARPDDRDAADMDDLLADLKQGGKKGAAGRRSSSVAAVASAPRREPPMGDEGLPVCWQVAPAFSRNTEVRAWAGPARAVITLFDRGPWPSKEGPRACAARQTLSIPPCPNLCRADIVARPAEAIEPAAVAFGALRVNSLDYAWNLVMSQKRDPPENAPVPLKLVNSRRPFVLEPYQRATFSYEWAQVVSTSGWAAVFIDQVNSRPAATADWATGARVLDNTVAFTDNGPLVSSVAPAIRFKRLEPGADMRLRLLFAFGFSGKPPPGKDAYRQAAAPRAILPFAAEPRPRPDVERLRALRQGEVLIVTPDSGLAARAPLWDRLAAAFDAVWRPAGRALFFVNTMADGQPPAGLTTVVVGERGANALLDQWNEAYKLVGGGPGTNRSALVLVEPGPGQGQVLAVAGLEEADTAAAVEDLIAALGPPPVAPDLVLSACDWADRMPWPWSGRRPAPAPFSCAAYRNGVADFLLLARANAALAGWRLDPPPGAQVRSVVWRFPEEGLTPSHDAAFPGLPPELPRDGLAAVWIRLRLPPDAAPGIRTNTAVFSWEGGRREVELRTEVLAPILPDKPPFGFNPMGLHKDMIAPYLGLTNDEAYLAALPGLLRVAGEFGVNTYTLDLDGVTLSREPAGAWVADGPAFRKEFEAARSAGVVDQFFVRSLSRFEGADLSEWVARAAALRRLFQDCGFSNNLVAIHGDEIADYETWIGHAELQAMAGVRMSVAINGYGVFNKQLAVGTMGFWIPLYNFFLSRWGKPIPDDDPVHFSRAFRDARRAAGEPIWPYVCGPGPYAWSARPRSQARFLMLDTYLKGADGLSYYGGTAWSHGLDPAFRNKQKADLFGKDHTFTTLFYPDPRAAALLPSLRAGSFRIGLDDVAAIAALRRRAAAQGRIPETEAAIQQAFSGLTMNAAQREWDAFRRELDRLWRAMEP